ncbi:TPA: cytoplasmic protein, partial [Salmonella enterica subsp. enterica serovar Typhimurium]|nr:cytoplasmic protein [Salmonella enterica subsp. enterica serovar Typhimurium]
MDAEFQKQGLTDLTETDLQAVVTPGETLRLLPTLARLLHVLREKPEAFS